MTQRPDDKTTQDTRVNGILFLSFQQACANLDFYLDEEARALLAGLTPEGWYPLEHYTALMNTVAGRYAQPGSILERVGEAMMHGWYHAGPGQSIISSGLDFLHYQTGSEGYHSLIDGPVATVGDFRLVNLDAERCAAQVQSTTPFSRDLERGVLRGGLTLIGDLRLVQVENAADPDLFDIRFTASPAPSAKTLAAVDRFLGSVPAGDGVLSTEAQHELGLRFLDLTDTHARQKTYWQASNQTLSDALLRDQDQRKALEQSYDELRAAERRTHLLRTAVLDLAADGIVTFDQTGRIVEFNPSAERIFGLSRQHVLANISASALLPAGALAERAGRATGEDTKRHKRFDVTHASGRSVPVTCAIRQVDLDGQRLSTAYISDLTDLVAAEQEIERQKDALLQSEKLTALGSLLSGVAHELNNPLSVVTGRARLLQDACTDPVLLEPLSKISKAAERCSSIIRTFLAMARQQPPERAPVEINQLVQEALDLVDYRLRSSNIEVARSLAADLPAIEADETQIGQVIVNLLINAQQAMAEHPEPRRMRVTTGRAEAAQDMLFLRVEDSGPGIPDTIRHRIFEPFFTTKKGTGNGVGLSLSHGIVASHGGRLSVADSSLGGAAFNAHLPIGQVSLGKAPPRSQTQANIGKALRILIVDDDPDVLETLADILRAAGHDTQHASNGQDALARISRATFDLVLSDLNMPGMSGPELFAELARSHPDYLTRVAFLTGDTLGDAVAQFLDNATCRFLEKPFTPQDVRQLVSEFQ